MSREIKGWTLYDDWEQPMLDKDDESMIIDRAGDLCVETYSSYEGTKRTYIPMDAVVEFLRAYGYTVTKDKKSKAVEL